MVSSRLSWGMATKTLASQANKVLIIIKRIQYKCGNIPFDVFCDIFDTMVVPILCYGSEIWGFEYCENIEKVQRRFIKYYLGVGSKTSNVAIYGESGRYPICVHYMSRCIKYWVKLLYMDNSMYPKSCYIMLYKLSEAGRDTWANKVKHLLYRYGFGNVWQYQTVGDDIKFLKIFKQRLLDCYAQEWSEEVQSNRKLSYYYLYKSEIFKETYLSCIENKQFRRSMSRFRCANHRLAVEVGRHLNIDLNQRLCKYCIKIGKESIEDEFHVLLVCEGYSDLRIALLPHYYNRFPSLYKFTALMSSTNVKLLENLGKYLYLMFKKRLEF